MKMNPIKADKIQFGSSSGLPHIRRSTTNELVFFDQPVGEISLSNILSERSVSEVVTVSKTTQGSDFSTIQEAVDFLPLSGGLIIIYQGTYLESISISKSVVLISRGKVVIESTDAPCLSLSSFYFKCLGLNFVLKDLLGNNNPSMIEVNSNDSTKKVYFYDCVFDNTAHPTSSFISVQTSSLFLSENKFFGTGTISVSQANTCEVLGLRLPDINLSNMIQRSYVSGSQILDITLVDSAISLSGNMNSCVGDATSNLTKEVITGEVVFDAELEKVVVFDCPLSSDSYTINLEPNTQRILPVISLKTATGFTVTFENILNETIRWSVAL